MRLEDDLKLSFYKEISIIGGKHDIALVQHVETKELFVRKCLDTYDRYVYDVLKTEQFPYVPKIVEIIEDGPNLIIIEEYIQGKNLEEILNEKLLSEEKAKSLLIKICEILKPIHTHQPSIIHRDIKPANIIIRDDYPFLIDFDISRDYDPKETKDTALMGTRMYAAPEQFGFSQSTIRTDIYALGVLLNVMIVGKAPSEELVKGSLGKIVKKCTAIDPEDRYNNVSELTAAIKGKPSTLAPPGFRSRKPIFMILAGLWYLIVIYLSMTIEVTRPNGDHAGLIETVITRFATLVSIGGTTLYLGNYLSILERFPFRKSASRLIEVIRIIFGSAVILFVPIVVIAILFT